MSRWIETFRNHAFHDTWSKIINEIENLNAADETIIADVEEVSRLKKVIIFIDELLQATDPELIPLKTWNPFNEQASSCLNQIYNYNNTKNIGHLNKANSNADSLLSYIRPYVVNGKGAAQAAGRAFKTYSESINNHIKKLSETAKSIVNETNDSFEQAKLILKGIEESKNKIDALEARLLTGNEEEDSLEKQILDLSEEIDSWHTKIESYFQKLVVGNEEETAVIAQITDAKTQSLKNASNIEDALKHIEDQISELSIFYEKIFGMPNRSGRKEVGLKEELDNRRQELDAFKESQQQKYNTLIQEIEGLLPGATSAGLASAYKTLKDSFDTPIKTATNLFYFALAGLLFTSLLLITDKAGFWYIDFIEVNGDDPRKLLINVIYKLPFFIPLLWLAIYASKRRSENRRLQQEYAHKEALAKSYHGFKQQIESLKTPDENLMKKLLEQAIVAIAFNASTTLDGKHGDKMPALEFLDKLVELGKIDYNPFKK